MKNILNNFYIKIIIFNVSVFFLFLFSIFKNIDAFSLAVFIFIILNGFATAIIFFSKEKLEIVLFTGVLFSVFLWLLLAVKNFYYIYAPEMPKSQDFGDLKALFFFSIFPIIFYFFGFLFGAVLKEKFLKHKIKKFI